jgi:enterochelin esterase-like enzyme
LGDVVDWYKTMTTNAYMNGIKNNQWTPFNERFWQRNYYEHIIRDEDNLNRIRQYISKSTYYPVLYLMGGYNMSVSGLANGWIQAALDGLILTHDMQKMIIVIPDGMNYKNDKNGRGHFFVNQIDHKRGDNFMDYFFDLVTYIDGHYKTK